MRTSETAPIVLAFPLDYGAEDVIEAAAALAKALEAPVLPVHAVRALHARAIDRERDMITAWLDPLARRHVAVQVPVVEAGRPERVVSMVSARVGAPLTVVGSGRGSTLKDWLLGTTAERIVRASAGPVWIARGTLPTASAPVLVPTDLGDQTRLAILAGARWARMFGAGLRILHVLPELEPLATDRGARAIEDFEAPARARIAEILMQVEIDVPVEVRIAHGALGPTLASEAEQAGLVVILQPDYEMLVAASLDSHVERLVRTSRTSILALRDDDVERQRTMREERARWVAVLSKEAEDALTTGDPKRAERFLASAKLAAPVSPAIEELLARAVEGQGRTEEATRHRALAVWLRAAAR